MSATTNRPVYRTGEYVRTIKEEQALEIGDVFIVKMHTEGARYRVGWVNPQGIGVLLGRPFAYKNDAVSFARSQRADIVYENRLYDFTREYGKSI